MVENETESVVVWAEQLHYCTGLYCYGDGSRFADLRKKMEL